MLKINKKLRIERELIACEMYEAIMRADVEHIAERRCMTYSMIDAMHRLYDWAERAVNELG